MVAVRLQSVGPQKIATIKLVRELVGCGLKEAKDLVEAAPVILRLDQQSDAREVVASFAAVGVTVEVQGDVDSQGPTAPDGPGPFCVRIVDVGSRKIQVIKALRDVTHLDLRAAKDLADGGEFEVGTRYDAARAEQVAALFREAGARVRIMPGSGPPQPTEAPPDPRPAKAPTKPPPGKIGPIPYF